jgi:hypothetical protein
VEVLAEAGYGEGDIDAMLTAGATHQHGSDRVPTDQA